MTGFFLKDHEYKSVVSLYMYREFIQIELNHHILEKKLVESSLWKFIMRVLSDQSDYVVGFNKECASIDTLIEISPMKVFPETYSFAPIKQALEEIKKLEEQVLPQSLKRQTGYRKTTLEPEEKSIRDINIILAQFALLVCSRVNAKNKIFLSEVLIVINLFRITIINRGQKFVLRRSTEEKIDLEDESKASTPISPILVMSNVFILDLFPKLLKEITWYFWLNRHHRTYFGDNQKQVHNLIQLMSILHHWLQANQLCDVILELNYEG